jgi:uncharacterized protein YjbI with pentapeptide repeats
VPRRMFQRTLSCVVVLAIVAGCASAAVPPEATGTPNASQPSTASPSPTAGSVPTDAATLPPSGTPGATATSTAGQSAPAGPTEAPTAAPGTPATPGTPAPTDVPGPTDAPGPTETPGPIETPGPTSTPGPSEPPSNVILPAGMQYDNGVKLPRKIDWPLSGVQADADGTLFALVSRGVPGGAFGRERFIPQLAAQPPGGAWQMVDIDDGRNFAAPRGYPENQNGLTAGQMVKGRNGYVTYGTTSFWTPGFSSATHLGIVHTSHDLRNWKRVDLRKAIGASRSVAYGSLTATDAGYLLAVATSTVNESAKSEIVVLTSADGANWKKMATLRGARWSTVPGSIYELGGRLVLTGYELACESDSTFFATFTAGYMLRTWTSDDTGRTWTSRDVDGSIFPSKEPNPTVATCRKVKGAYRELDERFGTSSSIAGVANGLAVVHMGPGGSQAATSRDFQTWTIADLPGAVPVDRTPETFSGSSGRDYVIPDAGGITLLSSQGARKPDNSGSLNGTQILGWHTADGQSWTFYPLPVPLAASAYQLSVGGDGLVRFVEVLGAPLGQDRTFVLFTSRPGPPIPYGDCAPGPNASCRFATLTDFDGRGLDAPGIDLTRARIDDSTFGRTPADWSGANLSGAQLFEAVVLASLTNANLSGITARKALLLGDLTGANMNGADLTLASVGSSFFAGTTFAGATLDGLFVSFEDGDSLENLDLSGLDLEDVSFYGDKELVNMRNVNFAGADLDWASFHLVDLTGANFRGASMVEMSFSEGTICPNGKATKKPEYRWICSDLTP